ncbi:epithelial sodium channel subunit beta-2-like [Diadema antillarum]|uniref:epithelial sodium channel subunit beta-2-like n=1 Tax=Diadema antillarum TaxID=105358 RepID=UPI003A8B2B56
MDDSASPMSTADVIKDFADNATTHGVPRILRSDRSNLSRLTWAVITLTSLSALLYQGSNTVVNFFQRPTMSKIALITRKELHFPSITICNLNMMRRSKLNGTRFEGLVDLDDQYAHLQNESTAHDSIDSVMDMMDMGFGDSSSEFTAFDSSQFPSSMSSQSSSFMEMDYQSWDGMKDPNDWKCFYNRSQMSDFSDLQAVVKPYRDELDEYGQPSMDLIRQCSFDTEPCSYKNFTKIQDIRYGNCYIFNQFKKSAVKTRSTGSQYGLHLTLFVDEPEYIGVLSPTVGVIVTINHPSIFPFPEDDGILVSTGQVASIGLKRTYVSRLPKPYGDCGKGGEDYYAPDKYDFSQRSCFKMCLEREMLKRCKCVTNILVNGTICSPINKTQQKCRTEVFKKYIRNTLGCDCENPCDENVYNARISTARWPSERYEEHLYMRLSSKNDTAARFRPFKEHVGKNLVRLKIYFEKLNFERVMETPLYTV